MVLVLGIVKASLKILGIGIGVKKVVLLMSVVGYRLNRLDELVFMAMSKPLLNEFGIHVDCTFQLCFHERFVCLNQEPIIFCLLTFFRA